MTDQKGDDEPVNKRRSYGNKKEKRNPKDIQEMKSTQCDEWLNVRDEINGWVEDDNEVS